MKEEGAQGAQEEGAQGAQEEWSQSAQEERAQGAPTEGSQGAQEEESQEVKLSSLEPPLRLGPLPVVAGWPSLPPERWLETPLKWMGPQSITWLVLDLVSVAGGSTE